MGCCWFWGAGPPQTFSVQVGYLPLCRVCMFSPCSQGVSSTKNPNRTLSCPSQTKMEGSLDLFPGRLKSCPLLLGSWRKDSPGWEKYRSQIHADLGLRVHVCVSCVASIYARS